MALSGWFRFCLDWKLKLQFLFEQRGAIKYVPPLSRRAVHRSLPLRVPCSLATGGVNVTEWSASFLSGSAYATAIRSG